MQQPIQKVKNSYIKPSKKKKKIRVQTMHVTKQ